MTGSRENTDIDDMLMILSSFESKCQDKVMETIQIREQLTHSSQAQLSYKQQLESKNRELIQLQDSVDIVQSSLGDFLHQQGENFALKNIVKELQTKSEEQNADFEKKKNSWREDLGELERKHALEMDEIRKNHDCFVCNMKQRFDHDMTLKTKRIDQLEIQLDDADKEKKEEVTKLKLEYEARLMKAMRQNCSNLVPTQSSGINDVQDIYRRKLDHIQQRHMREISDLKLKITELQEQLRTGNTSKKLR